MIGKTNSGAGNSLNFRVLGGTTEPSNPRENDIWVKTSIPISSVNLMKSIGDTIGNEGMVIIIYEAGSGGNVAKELSIIDAQKNGIKYTIQGRFIRCLQFYNNNWHHINGHIYRLGEWVQFSIDELFLFNNGDQCLDITGGWGSASAGWKAGGNIDYVSDSSCRIENNELICVGVANEYIGIAGTNRAINLSGYNYLYIDITYIYNERELPTVEIRTAKDVDNNLSNVVATQVISQVTGKYYIIDISYLTGEYYVLIHTTESAICKAKMISLRAYEDIS